VLWGDSDGIVDAGYGRAYAAAIPMARFRLLPDAGHSPQLETPDQVIHAIWDSADTGFPATRTGPASGHEGTTLRSDNP
jgi:pimeloyl-ACP methyl ester carboxylesterase